MYSSKQPASESVGCFAAAFSAGPAEGWAVATLTRLAATFRNVVCASGPARVCADTEVTVGAKSCTLARFYVQGCL